ncbi:HAMP domain-containing protein [Jiella sp. 40Bstr34]|uniref:histidine kinase n=2 Tax=Jiella pacifica TaxID=2696469 RepID=A0A6N9T2U7_9HYPH|nr:HAMP domain-containing protein [Jiella pacifica]
MTKLLRWAAPRTIRGQITVVIVIAVVAVVITGRGIESLRKSDYFGIQDFDVIMERASMVALLLQQADPVERRPILRLSAAATHLNLTLSDNAALKPMIAASPPPGWLETVTRWLFPPDVELPAGGRRFVIDGRPAMSLPVDGETVLLVRDLPSAFITDDFISPLSYYVSAFVTLMLLFSIYAVRSMTAPLARISAELNRSDGVSEDTVFDESGSEEVTSLARALNGMRTRIREMVDTRTRMLRSVSHDLRTPLTRLRLRTERLDDGEMREMMIADIDHINALVNETLDYLRTDASGEDAERTDIASLIQTIQANFADVGFAVTYEGPDRLTGVCKPNGLTRAVTNLCDNALKFAGSAAITLARAGPMIRIDVADDGPGIAANQRARVIEPFFKLDPARGTGRSSSFGLGLSIVTDIVRAHGGRLEFHDNHPRGLIARILLPGL